MAKGVKQQAKRQKMSVEDINKVLVNAYGGGAKRIRIGTVDGRTLTERIPKKDALTIVNTGKSRKPIMAKTQGGPILRWTELGWMIQPKRDIHI